MINKIAKKLKNIFRSKEKTAPARSVNFEKSKEIKHRTDRTQFRKKHRKKETPEEYRARRAKLDLNKGPNQSEKPKGEKKPPIIKSINETGRKKEIDNWNISSFKVLPADGKTRFHDFNLSNGIMHAIKDLGFEYCTKVQAETLPKSLLGEDITAQAQTGTGKTAAFLISILNHIENNPIDKKRKHGTPRALILAPTRELVLQIEKDARGLSKYLQCNILALLGGIDYGKQQELLKKNEIDILICTPGRLIDFKKKRIVDLHRVEILVIDEADRMLDMGFIPDVKRIVLSTPQKSKRQTMFFSATITGDVEHLSKSWTRQAMRIVIEPEEIAQKNIEQITYITTVDEKMKLLYNIIIHNDLKKVLVFANRRDDTKKLKDNLDRFGISCALLNGHVEQSQRIKRLERFREGKIRVLVATDVASRGIHVEGISHVINFNMPEDPEDYVHRIGRTGRAGSNGISINFADEEDGYALSSLEEFLGKKIKCVFPDEELLKEIPASEIRAIKKDSKNYRGKKKPYKSKNNNNHGRRKSK